MFPARQDTLYEDMFDWLTRLALQLPSIRSLHQENDQLRDSVRALEQQLSSRNREKLWVPAGHFYSPLVDPADTLVRKAIETEAYPETPPEDFGIDEKLMFSSFDAITEFYRNQPFPQDKSAGFHYYYGNANFPLFDAIALLAFMARLRPRRLIEIGSGFSSCAAIDINERYLGSSARLTFIDPHPELALQLIGETSPWAQHFHRSKLQDAALEQFQELDPNDILFIDSSHVAKTGSDVLDYLFRIFPALRPGVLVHIHDIFYPFEYPGDWINGENRSWNEAYFLRAWLQGGGRMQVLFWSDWFYKCRRTLLAERMPLCVEHRGGSLWLQVT